MPMTSNAVYILMSESANILEILISLFPFPSITLMHSNYELMLNSV